VNVDLWTTHSLDKIFPESLKPGGAAESIELTAARNETEDAQVALRVPRGLEIGRASFSLPDLVGSNGGAIDRANLSASWIWCLYVLNNPPENHDPASYLRKAPAFFPDAFLEEKAIAIRDEWTQSLWVSVSVPKDTAPGRYAGAVGIDLVSKAGEKQRLEVPIEVTVLPFTLPDQPSLHHTEWFWEMPLARYYGLEPWSQEHWRWIAKVAEDMVRHRQDMILTPFTSLITITRRDSGRFSFDFTKLDRWINTFRKAGITWIEGSHVAGRVAGWESDFGWRRFQVQGPGGRPLAMSRDKVSEAEFEPFVEAFLKSIRAHLKQKGWDKHYIQHVADEPLPANEASWAHCAQKVREWLPGVPTIDAVMSGGLKGLVDWRVPQIQEIGPDTPRNSGEDLWSYVCLAPQGHYPNRFLDYPSIRNRIIFWLSWSLGLKGFLHWGYNSWKSWQGVPVDIPVSPWLDATGASIYCADRNPLPSGDTHIVYPGRSTICSSLRWEVIRKGCEDFEYLHLLGNCVESGASRKKPRAAAAGRRLLARVRSEVAADPLGHTRDDRLLLSVREEVGRLLAELGPDA
jgi:hypothetical protein